MMIIDTKALTSLFEVLRERQYCVVGPTVRDKTIVYDELGSVDDLPRGWTEEQDGGTYRLKRRGDEALFGYTVPAQSWKRYLYPPVVRLWRARREPQGMGLVGEPEVSPRYALLGVRACDLQAIEILDRVLLHGAHVDPVYRKRRERAFIVAVNCGQAAKTCFCVSMDTGPRAKAGFDIALTEVIEDGQHYFVAEAGSDRGSEVLGEIPQRAARQEDVRAAERVVERAASQMGRKLVTKGLKDALEANIEHPRWDEVAKRCLMCGNCTMVCPTCFCTTVHDVSDLGNMNAERWRHWDSCVTMDFSYLHGGHVRASGRSRYRHWLMHKLARWHDQFGTSGCVGCGRCITWCPVGIDITEEASAVSGSS
jgi:sulfhydrogenase subunit beta (sulfur reductase)